jgi:N6-L-threonylcarbamoyladenine synthase
MARSLAAREPLVLGIDTSCDDTSVSLVGMDGGCVVQNLVSSQDHSQYGGVHPTFAARAHREALPGLLSKAAGLVPAGHHVGAVAVTVGPGLDPCLWAGVRAARVLGASLGVPVVPVNHLDAHVLTGRLASRSLAFPFLALLVSGGHTLLAVARGPSLFEELGATRDDSLGEALDKVARMLGVADGGKGLELAARASSADRRRVTPSLPVPLRGSEARDFSFSGLKSHISRALARQQQSSSSSSPSVGDWSAAVQHAAFSHIVDRTKMAMAATGTTMPLVVCGGVASNSTLRSGLQAALPRTTVIAPPLSLCTDNAAMVAWAAIEQGMRGVPVDSLWASPRLGLGKGLAEPTQKDRERERERERGELFEGIKWDFPVKKR